MSHVAAFCTTGEEEEEEEEGGVGVGVRARLSRSCGPGFSCCPGTTCSCSTRRPRTCDTRSPTGSVSVSVSIKKLWSGAGGERGAGGAMKYVSCTTDEAGEGGEKR